MSRKGYNKLYLYDFFNIVSLLAFILQSIIIKGLLESMKIGKITLNGYINYGNVLQNYALNHALEKYGEVSTLWITPDNFLPRTWYKWKWKEYIKFIFNIHGFRDNILSAHHGMEIVRQGKIKEWCDRNINIIKVNVNNHLFVENYDCFIVGSDQVWNPINPYLEQYFLSFANYKKRIAYSASIASPNVLEKQRENYSRWISGMAHISMREKQGAELVNKICGRTVPVLVDPTLLLTTTEWSKVSRPPAWYNGDDYILTYFLGKRPDVVARLEKDLGLKAINLLDENVYEHYVTGPDEFIWAIEHARLVYTDSFHGTVFSILFRTPFVVCNRVGDEVTEKMCSRIDTLLELFGLEERRGTKAKGYAIENPLSEPDWSNVDEVLERERKRAADYLQMALLKEI